MTALLLVIALFAGWSLVGLALLSLVRAETSELRVVLTAPVIGTCVTVLVTFPFSEAGLAIEQCAVPIAIALLLGSAVIVALRRPSVHPGVLPVAVVCVAGLLLAAWPMFSLGFDWLANGNDDMSNYVLSAQELLKHGLLAPFDLKGFAEARDFATALTSLHLAGGRPGSDILLAFVSRVAGRPPYQTFMPLILAFNLCTASAVAALAMQIARRWWAAVLAAALLLASPLATYGVLQQLLPQVWGLGLVAALFALLMRPELHSGRGARVREIVPIGVITTSLVLGYIELVPEMGLAYVLYVAVLGFRKQLGFSALLRLWLPALALIVIVLNSYFFKELEFLHHQVSAGLATVSGPPLFGYILVPSGLPGIVGLQTLPPGFEAAHLDLSILLATGLLAAALLASVVSAYRGAAAATVLVVEAALAVPLVIKGSDFGLFKLTMYIQPFLAAAVAIWISGTRRRWLRALVAVPLALLVLAGLSSQRAYVTASRDPEDVPHLSASDVIPAFHSVVTNASDPVVSVTENPVLIKLEAASADGRPVYFQSRNVLSSLRANYGSKASGRSEHAGRGSSSDPWVPRSFHLLAPNGGDDNFEEDTNASRSLASGRCELVMPGAADLPFNSYSLLASSPDLVAMSCHAPHDLLAFTNSTLGESFYLPLVRRNISFFQLQGDPFFNGRMVGFGRYALFQVLGPSTGERMVIELTDTLTHDGSNLLPPAAVVGASRLPLPLEGRGSARVFSPPLKPQMIAGTSYVLIDLGVNGRLPVVSRNGIEDIYGRSVPTDPRYLTSYVRDISLVSAAQYAGLRRPLAVQSFPAGLDNPNLEYSGIYEDGWMGADGYLRLAGGPAADLVVQGQVPAGAGKRLELLVNRRRIASVAVGPGPLDLRVPVAASKVSRRVELHFAATIKLKAPDLRPAAALLSFVGFVAPHQAP